MSRVALEVRTDGGWHRFTVRFANTAQAVAYIKAHGDRNFSEIEDEQLITESAGMFPLTQGMHELLGILYPTCHHGMDATMCLDPYGPHHWGTAEWERAMDWQYSDAPAGF